MSLPLEIEAGKTCRYMESPDGVFSWYLKMATACGLHVVHECVYAAYSELLAQRIGLRDEALERMSEATIQTMARALGRLLALNHLQRVSLPEDVLRLHSWQVRGTCVQ